jgi:nitrate reductase NapE component
MRFLCPDYTNLTLALQMQFRGIVAQLKAIVINRQVKEFDSRSILTETSALRSCYPNQEISLKMRERGKYITKLETKERSNMSENTKILSEIWKTVKLNYYLFVIGFVLIPLLYHQFYNQVWFKTDTGLWYTKCCIILTLPIMHTVLVLQVWQDSLDFFKKGIKTLKGQILQESPSYVQILVVSISLAGLIPVIVVSLVGNFTFLVNLYEWLVF